MAGQATKVAEKVWLVGNGGWGGSKKLSKAGDGNVYLIDGGNELALIDTGVGPNAEDILENISAAGFDPENLGKILLTHAHSDHSGAALWLRNKLGVRIIAGSITAKALSLPEKLLIGDMEPFKPSSTVPFQANIVLQDKEEIKVGNAVLKALYTPGHTIDSVCYLTSIDGQKILFSGDTLVGNQPRKDCGENFVLKGMLGWLDGHWSTPISGYIKTLEALLEVKPDTTLPGHGIPNDTAQTQEAISVGIGNLKKIIDNPTLKTMFAISW